MVDMTSSHPAMTAPDPHRAEPGNDTWCVTDPAAAHLLWFPRKRIHLRPFLGRSATVAEAAALLGLRRPVMNEWVQRLLDVGLIRRLPVDSADAATRDHAVARYRCPADCLQVSMADAPLESHEEIFEDAEALWLPQVRPALAQSLAHQAADLELTISASDEQGLVATLLPRAGRVPIDDYVYYWGRLWLNTDERDELRGELDALWNKYAALSDRSNKKAVTLMHLVAVPEDHG
jgi:hypothetical protein